MIPVNKAQQQLQGLIDSVSESHQPIIIAGERSNAVLLSEADWTSVQETLYLLSVPPNARIDSGRISNTD